MDKCDRFEIAWNKYFLQNKTLYILVSCGSCPTAAQNGSTHYNVCECVCVCALTMLALFPTENSVPP